MNFNDKPLCVAEMSSMDAFGQKALWIRSTWNSLAYQYPRITGIVWFLANKGQQDLDLNTSEQRRAYSEGFRVFKYATGGVGDASERFVDAELQQAALRAEAQYFEELGRRGITLPERTPVSGTDI